jgi:hypothetical protein
MKCILLDEVQDFAQPVIRPEDSLFLEVHGEMHKTLCIPIMMVVLHTIVDNCSQWQMVACLPY